MYSCLLAFLQVSERMKSFFLVRICARPGARPCREAVDATAVALTEREQGQLPRLAALVLPVDCHNTAGQRISLGPRCESHGQSILTLGCGSRHPGLHVE